MADTRSISNLSLIGLMGAGKSTIGRSLAKTLRYQFIDTDQLIEKRTNRKIAEIFQTDGEAHFRALECALAKEIAKWQRTVIASGGGLPTHNRNLDLLKKSSFIVCLWASPETIYRRVKNQKHRPLLQTENPLETIRKLLRQRTACYKQSDAIILTDNRPLRLIASLVIQEYRQAQNKTSQPTN